MILNAKIDYAQAPRTAIEAAFSAIKQHYCVRSVTPRMQERELAIVSICRNIGA